jgi:hypothetical protein
LGCAPATPSRLRNVVCIRIATEVSPAAAAEGCADGGRGTQLHFLRGETNLLADLLDQFLRRWEGFRAERNGQCARLVWRETTPRHFKHAGGEYMGKQDLNSTCVHSSLKNDPRNQATAATLRKYPWALQLPVWHMLHKRPDAHTNSECTHWCQPGVMEKVVRVLYSLLLARDGGRLAVRL